jgi:hypothetical protein
MKVRNTWNLAITRLGKRRVEKCNSNALVAFTERIAYLCIKISSAHIVKLLAVSGNV